MHSRSAFPLLLILFALAPSSSAQVIYLGEGETSFYVGGGISWMGHAPKAGTGGEVGAALGWFDLGLAYVRFPAAETWTADDALAFSVGMTPFRYPETPVDIGLFASFQQTSLSHDPAHYGTWGAEGEASSLALGVAWSLPVGVRERGRVVPSVRVFHASQRLSRPGTNDDGRTDGAFAWMLSLGAREDLPGPFSLVVEPSIGMVGGTGLVRGVTVRLLSVGRRQPATGRTPP